MTGPNLDGAKLYLAPLGTDAPTAAELEGQDWTLVGLIDDDMLPEDKTETTQATLELVYGGMDPGGMLKPYTPNRADRRAAAKAARRKQ